MDFGDNLVTPGSDPSGKKLYHLCLPERLNGYSVLDVSAFDGFFSFHAAQRGARVVAADKYVWTWPGNTSYENFTTVRRLLTTPVEDIEVAVEELSEKISEKIRRCSIFGGALSCSKHVSVSRTGSVSDQARVRDRDLRG
jgi:hypothetical protein